MLPKVLEDIDQYYSSKILEHGVSPRGVDWKDEESQKLRFLQLLKVINKDEGFSLNDLGCGYGKLFEFMLEMKNHPFQYFGYDLSEQMIKEAQLLYGDSQQAKFIKIQNGDNMNQADFSVASGIFNVKMHYSEADWLEYILSTIESMNKYSTKGFAFNILTRYSDREYMRDDLYYADPCFFFDYMKRKYSRNVALLHDYNLYEFSMLVRKEI